MLEITVDGELYGTYSLSEDRTVEIGDGNVCRIENGQVTMIRADCPDQLCIHQKAIGSGGGQYHLPAQPGRAVGGRLREGRPGGHGGFVAHVRRRKRRREEKWAEKRHIWGWPPPPPCCWATWSLIPVFVTVPGMKLGLANLAVLLILYLYGWREGGRGFRRPDPAGRLSVRQPGQHRLFRRGRGAEPAGDEPSETDGKIQRHGRQHRGRRAPQCGAAVHGVPCGQQFQYLLLSAGAAGRRTGDGALIGVLAGEMLKR